MSPLRTHRNHFRAPFQDLPLDILHPILSQLSDRKDWHTCALVSKAFLRAAIPFLYRTLDSRIISKVSGSLILRCWTRLPWRMLLVMRTLWDFELLWSCVSSHCLVLFWNALLLLSSKGLTVGLNTDFGTPSKYDSPTTTRPCPSRPPSHGDR